jgi:hypothetical protein
MSDSNAALDEGLATQAQADQPSGAPPQRLFCSYCQRFKLGSFRKGGKYGTTRICEDCYQSRKRAKSMSARAIAAAKLRNPNS